MILKRLLAVWLSVCLGLSPLARAEDGDRFVVEVQNGGQADLSALRNRQYSYYDDVGIYNLYEQGLISKSTASQALAFGTTLKLGQKVANAETEAVRDLLMAILLAKQGFAFAADQAFRQYIQGTIQIVINMDAEFPDQTDIDREMALNSIYHHHWKLIEQETSHLTSSERQLIQGMLITGRDAMTPQALEKIADNATVRDLRNWQAPEANGNSNSSDAFIVLGNAMLVVPIIMGLIELLTAGPEKALLLFEIFGFLIGAPNIFTLPRHWTLHVIRRGKKRAVQLIQSLKMDCGSLLNPTGPAK